MRKRGGAKETNNAMGNDGLNKKYYDIILKRVADFNKNFETQTLFGNEM